MNREIFLSAETPVLSGLLLKRFKAPYNARNAPLGYNPSGVFYARLSGFLGRLKRVNHAAGGGAGIV
jgi:hypothetical protein